MRSALLWFTRFLWSWPQVVLQPLGESAGAAVGSPVSGYRHSLLLGAADGAAADQSKQRSSSQAAGLADAAVASPQTSLRGKGRLLQQTPTGSKDQLTWKNWVDNLSKRAPPKYRRWVKAALIIFIVLIVLSIIGMLWCIISCLCCPLCCCIRAVK